MRATTRTASATICVAAMLLLTACNGDGGDDPTTPPPSTGPTTTEPATTPSTEPSLTYEEDRIASAQAFVEAYYAESNAVMQDGYEDWSDRLGPFFSSAEVWAEQSQIWEVLAGIGGFTTGGTEVLSFEVTDWQPDPDELGADQVAFDVCLDTSGAVVFDDDGTKAPDDEQPTDIPYIAHVRLTGEPDDSDLGWGFIAYEETEAPC